MTACAYCGTDILFGGIRDGERRFCRRACYEKAEEAEREIRLAKDAYDQSLAAIRENPGEPGLHQQALNHGRLLASKRRRREGGRVTLYDETSIANEIEAASAAGSNSPQPPAAASLSFDERLERLASLRDRGLISGEEYAKKRSEILAEL